MSNHLTFAAWPVHCTDCAEIRTANFKNIPLSCLHCNSPGVTPISDASLWQRDGTTIESWRDLTLTDGHYRCPKCQRFDLRFSHGSMRWD
jgi:Zn finger protein HypA/HybF involved in hydrogenase expression